MNYVETLFQHPDPYNINEKKAQELREKAIKEAHRRYFDNISVYHKICGLYDVKRDISSITDVLPLMLTDRVFKSYRFSWILNDEYEKLTSWVSTLFHENISVNCGGLKNLDEWIERMNLNEIKVTFSAGTSGKFSFVPRDLITHRRFVESLLIGGEHFTHIGKRIPIFFMGFSKGYNTFIIGFNEGQRKYSIEEETHYLFDRLLSSDMLRIRMGQTKNTIEKIKKKWMSYLAPSMYKNAMKRISDNLYRYENKHISLAGSPFMINDLANMILEKRPIKLGKKSFVGMGGGWKASEERRINRRKLDEKIEEAFGIHPEKTFDNYGMTEMNSTAAECPECRNKHFQPWLEPILIDENLEPLHTIGEYNDEVIEGRFSFLDPSANSYPGFLMTSDKLKIDFGGCECGRKGPIIVDEVERIPVEARGCAAILDSMVQG